MSEKQLRKRVRELFEEGDLETLTERKVRQTLVKEFGPVAETSAAVGDELETILTELAEASEDDSEEYEEEKPSKASKKSTSNGGGVQGGIYVLPLSTTKKLQVKTFGKRVLVDLREWYTDKESGDEKPGKGISLNVEEWHKLEGHLAQLAQALKASDTDMVVHLSDSRRASVSEFRGKANIQVREYYADAQGEMKPGKKGLALHDTSIQALISHTKAIEAHVEKLGGKVEATTAKAASKAAAKESKAPATVDKESKEPAAASGAGGTEGVEAIDMGANKRVTLSTFSGSKMVDLREWYQKGSELAPGKKGISLKPADWQTVVDAIPAINAAVAAMDMSYVLHLTNKRKLTLSEFKGKLYVGIREMYLKDGKELPGAKGLSMSPEQWAKLAQGAAAFTAAAALP